ncbi:hypothetical protein BZA05DRAFT_44981 [Tricharina praecox]|uniref:uncharacterized protein n=1 Tax=Tricharina praecox TaxID=43433 RepID=UPI00221EF3E1|nr:uncharacterized protein BZA05DRAFT_44981 [Tricharina praecox]KAI5851838.1 hypothetical protein BZA05DRAFT_44981 [Tricharina praecox]
MRSLRRHRKGGSGKEKRRQREAVDSRIPAWGRIIHDILRPQPPPHPIHGGGTARSALGQSVTVLTVLTNPPAMYTVHTTRIFCSWRGRRKKDGWKEGKGREGKEGLCHDQPTDRCVPTSPSSCPRYYSIRNIIYGHLISSSIQSNPIQSNPIQSNPIQSNPIQSNSFPFPFRQYS